MPKKQKSPSIPKGFVLVPEKKWFSIMRKFILLESYFEDLLEQQKESLKLYEEILEKL